MQNDSSFSEQFGASFFTVDFLLTYYRCQSQASNHVQVLAHLGQCNCVVACIGLGKQWMRNCLVPDVERTIEVLVVHGRVAEFRNRMGEMKSGNGVGSQFIDFARIKAQIYQDQNEL